MSLTAKTAIAKSRKVLTVVRKKGGNAKPAAADPVGRESKCQRALTEESSRYRAIVDTAIDAIVTADRLGKIESFNPAAESIFGYSVEEAIGKNIKLLLPEACQEGHDGCLSADLKNGERKIIGIDREVQGKRKDGSIVPLALSVVEWRDIDGQQCFTCIMRDVTLRKQQASALQNAIEVAGQERIEAESANQAKTEFLAVMSHEIRTPLTSISGFVDLLAHTRKLTREQRRYVELVRVANATLLTIVNDILDFSKVEAGHLELDNRVFSPAKLIRDVLEIVQPIASAKHLLLKFSIERGISDWLTGDDARLRQILLNLLNNAVKFTDHGSIGVTVRRVAAADGRERIKFAVTDTGIGIPVERQHRLFKQFSQADSSVSRSHGGTGLGLAICKRLVGLMQGEIGVDSEAGAGTRLWFTAYLPAASEPAQDAGSELLLDRNGISKGHILLVDDLDTNQEIVKAYLEDGGYHVDLAGSAMEAINLLKRTRYDLVLMDIQMPIMDGVTATKIIRSMPLPNQNIPIIAMTGNVLPQQVQSFLDAGMNDHVGKPIERAKLYSKVWNWMPRTERRMTRVETNSDPFERAKFDELVDVLGAPKVEGVTIRFMKQLAGCFKSTPEAAKQEAHDLLNSAGVLGLDALVERCRCFVATPPGDKDRMAALLGEMRQAQTGALRIIESTILPELRALSLRPTG
jgi:PAS domain S-box-containing protein